ncbi:MAG TPA: hypothetical protein VEQ41_10010 [Solirubrobacterales bacterium]|nr:hypothetical protein [Solirubrobacterales bacterium]
MARTLEERGRRIAIGAALGLLGLAAGLATIASMGADAAPRKGPDQTRLILRLSDLPLGYVNFDLQESEDERIFCSHLTNPDDTPPRLARFIVRYRPKGCIDAYSRLYSLPGQTPSPALAGTGVMALGSDAAADAGWAVAPEIIGRDDPPREVRPSERVGRATRLFHAPTSGYLRQAGRAASFLVWRSGNTLAVVEAVADSYSQADRMAAELARLQQAHIRKPTRYTRAERFDGEVGLDDPAIDLPVYWLGRNFRPGRGLPENRLYRSGFTGKPIAETTGFLPEGPTAPLEVHYATIWLKTWTPETWPVFARSKTARAITTWKCTRTRTIALPDRTATIFGGYKEDFRRCPKDEPRAFTAWVDVGGVRIVVNAPPAPDFIETANPYGSFEGMEAIVRGLTLRPKRF